MKICLFFILMSGMLLAQSRDQKQELEKERRELGIQLLQRAQQAMGGAEKLAAIKDMTRTMETMLASPTGPLKAKQVSRFVIPNHLRTEGESKIGNTIIYTNGKSGWLINDQRWLPIPDELLTKAKGELFRQLPTLLLSDSDASRTIKAVSDAAVEISTKDRLKVRIEFDPPSGLPAQHLYTEPISYSRSRKIIATFSDWHEVGGIKLPYKIVHQEDDLKFFEATVSEYTINSGMTPEQLSKRP